MSSKRSIILAGAIVGILSALLVKLGNPANMGICIACFLRDISGSLGFHSAAVVQYIRPEVIGIILGAFGSAVVFKEYKSVGGSSPVARFILGIAVMIGALIFLGCPLRMVLRLAGGDLNALVGIAGFAVGIGVGIVFLNKGFSLKRNYSQNPIEGSFISMIAVLLLLLLVIAPSFIKLSTEGPGSLHAPVVIALGFGIVTGVLAQRSRLCMVGGIRDLIMFKDTYLIIGFIAIIVAAAVGNIAFGNFHVGFEAQPIAHSDGLWNFIGMIVVGWGSVLLGGCPLRQLVLSGEGNSDSAVTIFGLIVGAGIAHNFGLAASPKGVPTNGKIAVAFLIVTLLVISYTNIQRAYSKSSSVKEVKANA